ncbi:MAG: hypothetical protein VW619_05280 [Rhodobiaceae bacterium]
MTTGSQDTDGRDARPDPLTATARQSILAGFLGLGLFMGMWGALVPARSTDLGLSELMIAGFLLLIGISLCAAIFMVTRFQPFQDPVRLIRYAGPAYAIGFALCLTTGSLPLFFLCGIFTGFAAGFVDTALNSQASQWEQATGRRAMSFFHALFSLGVLIGAGLVTMLMAHDPDRLDAGILGCAVIYGGFMAVRRGWIATADLDADDTAQPTADFRLPHGVIIFLGLAILLATLTEGGIIDWSALHLHRAVGLPVADAGHAVLWFSVAMTIIRFTGDWLTARIRPHLLLAVPLIIAAGLLMVAVTTALVPLLMTAYVVMGLALGNAFPIIISEAGRAAGDRPLREISIIVGFAYVGLISGPALFGVTAHFIGLDATLLLLGGLALALGLASFAMPRFAGRGMAG